MPSKHGLSCNKCLAKERLAFGQCRFSERLPRMTGFSPQHHGNQEPLAVPSSRSSLGTITRGCGAAGALTCSTALASGASNLMLIN